MFQHTCCSGVSTISSSVCSGSAAGGCHMVHMYKDEAETDWVSALHWFPPFLS